jgi:hypothetical protein
MEIAPIWREQNCGKTINQSLCNWVINPLAESPKIFVPLYPVLEYHDLNTQEQKSKDITEHNPIVKQWEYLSEVVYNLAKEEVYTENLLVYLTALVPEVQHFLFFLLVSKARLTTNCIRKTQKLSRKLDDSLNKIYNDIANQKLNPALLPNPESNPKLALEQSDKQSNKLSTKPFATAKIFDEIQVLRNLLSQIKIGLQAPMMFARNKSLVDTYNSVNDLGNPRFTSMLLPKKHEITEKSVYRNMPGEKDNLVVWEDALKRWYKWTSIHNQNRQDFWNKLGLGELVKDSQNINVESTQLPVFSDDNRTQIENEEHIGNVERLERYHDYFGFGNVEKLRVMFWCLELIAKYTMEYVGQNSLQTSEHATNKPVPTLENALAKNISEVVWSKSNPNNWLKILEYAALIDQKSPDGSVSFFNKDNLQIFSSFAKIATDYNIPVDTFRIQSLEITGNTISSVSYRTKHQMPSWANDLDTVFDGDFLEFLHQFRFRSDLNNLKQNLTKNFPILQTHKSKLTIDQRINIAVDTLPLQELAKNPYITTKIANYHSQILKIQQYVKSKTKGEENSINQNIISTPDQYLNKSKEGNII